MFLKHNEAPLLHPKKFILGCDRVRSACLKYSLPFVFSHESLFCICFADTLAIDAGVMFWGSLLKAKSYSHNVLGSVAGGTARYFS